MGTIVSSILYPEDPSEEIEKKNSYNKIFDSLNKISSTLDDTKQMIKDIEESLRNPEIEVMEWDYFDTPILENKNLPTFDF